MDLESFNIHTSRLRISGFKNKVTHGNPVIALHGWLDNAASFIPLSNYLSIDRPVFFIDLPGHGLSEHRPESASYHLVENVVDVLALIEAIECLGYKTDKVSLLGHSLGGIICCMLAAASPSLVRDIVLLDSLGPLTDKLENVLPQFRDAVKKAMQIKSKVSVFPSIDLAVKARMLGIGRLDKDAASILVKRGTKKVEGGFSWTTDPKLLKPSFLRFSEAQVEALFAGIECPVKLIKGEEGYFVSYKNLKQRLAYFKNIDHVSVNGGHHFHMDGDVKKTAEYINAYLEN